MLVIDENGEQVGILETQKALALAREKELDLIEVAPNAKPPVAKIYSWSKFKYQQEKKRKENKGKSAEQKEIWFKVAIAKGDLEHKLKKVKELIAKKHPVKLTIRGKGRIARERFENLMKQILIQLDGFAEAESEPKFDGHNMHTIVKPSNKSKLITEKDNEEENKNT